MLDLIRRYSALYLVEILGFCLMGNHFHILVRMFPEHKFTDEDIQKRHEDFYGDDRIFAAGQIPFLREKLSNLSEFVREIKVGFTRYYNKRHNRILRIPESSALKNLFLKITSGLKVCLCPSGRRSLNWYPGWTGFIH